MFPTRWFEQTLPKDGSVHITPYGMKLIGLSIAGPKSRELLQRLTGVSIDASGNVWVCNNWLPIPVQTNPGGDALVEFVGIGGPVKMPLLGLPKQP